MTHKLYFIHRDKIFPVAFHCWARDREHLCLVSLMDTSGLWQEQHRKSHSIINVFLWATRSTDGSFCFQGNVCEDMQERYAGSSAPDPTCLSHVNHLSVITQQVILIVQAGTWKTKAVSRMWGLKWLASAENHSTRDNYVLVCELAWGSPFENLVFRRTVDMQCFFCKLKYIWLNKLLLAWLYHWFFEAEIL